MKEESTFVNYSTDEPVQCSVNCVVSYVFWGICIWSLAVYCMRFIHSRFVFVRLSHISFGANELNWILTHFPNLIYFLFRCAHLFMSLGFFCINLPLSLFDTLPWLSPYRALSLFTPFLLLTFLLVLMYLLPFLHRKDTNVMSPFPTSILHTESWDHWGLYSFVQYIGFIYTIYSTLSLHLNCVNGVKLPEVVS